MILRLLKTITLTIGGVFLFAFGLNRGYVIWQWSGIRDASWWVGGRWAYVLAGLIVFLFLIVFPILYVLQSKIVVLWVLFKILRAPLRALLQENLIAYLSHHLWSMKDQWTLHVDQLRQLIEHWITDLPSLLRFVLRQIIKRIGLLDQLYTSLMKLDMSKIWSQQELKDALHASLDSHLEQGPPLAIVPVVILVIVNLLVMWGVYMVVHVL